MCPCYYPTAPIAYLLPHINILRRHLPPLFLLPKSVDRGVEIAELSPAFPIVVLGGESTCPALCIIRVRVKINYGLIPICYGVG